MVKLWMYNYIIQTRLQLSDASSRSNIVKSSARDKMSEERDQNEGRPERVVGDTDLRVLEIKTLKS